ncbi:carbon-nitrogen hydrolase family protein [Brevibacillus nitrificans]|uniref:Carbon-nitrogen hydrolase family protein n=1 Tax=Brevibacillus nitrificans TaxID=651560 RepID=A0A3M8CTU9_9BACL|nr:carbon-nitrogen hydrolase family protein [Brevibacillus nitrificans]RNB79144.1 carbon-nitrogen hydrolase family protein [Brevibacillus nitrificans]
MTTKFRLAMAQVGSTSDKQANYEKAVSAVREAVIDHQAQMVVFPEIFMSYFPAHTPMQIILDDAEPLEGPFVTKMKKLAEENGVWLIFGMKESGIEAERVFNSVVIVASDGSIAGTYRKTHLYDAFGYKESDTIEPGSSLFEPIQTPFGKIGLLVCYELRFPEIARYQAAKGAEVMIVPSGWVRGPMKEHHWSHLVTVRALENTVFVVACNQVSDFYSGQSLVADPMGVQMVTGPETEALIVCDIDLSRIESVRTKLPSYGHRRPELYTISH